MNVTGPSPSAVDEAGLVARAGALADDELFPRAIEADRAGHVPTLQLDLLAEAGLYGAGVTASPATVAELIEIIASGCLTTGFIWTQHLGASRAARDTAGAAGRFADDLATGALRGGVAFAHMLRPDPPMTTAEPTADGWRFYGTAPWVTGWGHIDLVLAAARHDGDIVWALIDAVDAPTLRADRPDLAAVHSTQTVELTYDAHPVPGARVTQVIDRDQWLAGYRLGLRNNGSFPLGVAARCCRLLERPSFDRRLVEVRQALDAADTDHIAAARAEAALFAVTVSTALVACSGGRSVTVNDHAQRLHREAMFLLVQGQTPAIRASMVERLEQRLS